MKTSTMDKRALSLAQAARCETATHERCTCRCGGMMHGRVTVVSEDGEDRRAFPTDFDRAYFEEMPENDPHHLPTKARQKAARKRRKAIASGQLELSFPDAPTDLVAIVTAPHIGGWYRGRMLPDGTALVEFEEAGRVTRLPHVGDHGEGYGWGYSGSGPADLALSVLCHALDVRPKRSRGRYRDTDYESDPFRLHQKFKQDFITHLPQGQPWRIAHDDVLRWVADHPAPKIKEAWL